MEEDDVKLDIFTSDNGSFDPDEEYSQECGYSLIQTLRGSSTGRQMKRCLFWLSLYQLAYGVPVFIMSVYEDNNFSSMNYYTAYSSGSSLLGLQYGTSILALIFGLMGFAAVRYWSTMVTNRDLLVNLLVVYQVVLLIMWIMIIVTIAKLFGNFEDIDWKGFTGQVLLPLYICTIVCLFPYMIALMYYGLDVSFLAEGISYGATIAEPEPLPDHTLDLNGLTMMHLCFAAIALPLMAMESCRDFAADWFFYVDRIVKKKRAESKARGKARRKSRKSMFNRVTKTISRMYNEVMKGFGDRKKAFEDKSALSGLTDQSEGLMQDAAAARLAALIAERDAKDLEARRLKEIKDREEALATIMTARKFKEMWTSLGSAGSFQCKLKTVALKQSFVEHIRKQGFNVVFVADPDAGGFEVGVCNVREEGVGGPWFMARFMTREKTFSAVMKCQDPGIVTSNVKKFALAKVLRIDTSG
jgi:hypothetical protein